MRYLILVKSGKTLEESLLKLEHCILLYKDKQNFQIHGGVAIVYRDGQYSMCQTISYKDNHEH